MDSIINKNDQVCANCVYWGGERHFTNGNANFSVDRNSRGPCSFPGGYYNEPALKCPCRNFSRHPGLR